MSELPGNQAWQVAIDRGGTFTDLVARAPDGRIFTEKVLSVDPHGADDPAVRALRLLLQRAAPDGAVLGAIRLGTTVATNALLERRGEPTVLVTNQGMRDALAIGYQHRPEIFARAIRKPPPLAVLVIEATGRCTAEGQEIAPLDEQSLRAQLATAHARGLRSVAIAFLHANLNPSHELHAAALARELGFDEVVASHAVASLPGFVARADTAVLDAYLSPVLLRYLHSFEQAVRREFGAVPVLYMQSNGGLVDRDGFRGVNALLSGPAGGVIGMIAAGALAGEAAVLGLDMGGTSTDLSICTGVLPRRYSREIDGVRVQAPSMDIQTIAAGGGSIVRYADARLQVGPQSAGADPGPACYRRGGPATITDCNVVLGRIQPQWFPAVFGPAGDASLDVDAARARLQALALAMAAPDAAPLPVEAVAEAALEVAVERSAQAIRELAQRSGADPQALAMVAFGGAAGQHACAIAEALGAPRIVLPALAGVLSAQGIALATRRHVARRGVERPLEDQDHALAALAALEREALDALQRQGVPAARIVLRRAAQVRAAAADNSLEVEFGAGNALRVAYLDAHRRLYGFVPEAPALVLSAVLVEAEESAAADAVVASHEPARAAQAQLAKVWFDGAWRRVPMFLRESLAADADLSGPALLIDAGATHWLAPGWRAHVLADRSVLAERISMPQAVALAEAGAAVPLDPRRLEIMGGLFMHVAEQMGATLQQTASSVNIRERLDFSCAIFDAQAALVANAPHMPVHLGSMGASVVAVRNAFGASLRPGDAYLLNSPYAGGTHLPDLTVVSPVFDGATGAAPAFFVASRAHHADIGGMTPGSMPPGSRHIDEEGALIEPLRIVRDARLDTERVLRLLADQRWPARDPARNLIDLHAQLAANARGIEELRRACVRHGRATVFAYMQHVQDNAADCLQRRIRALHGGAFELEMDSGARIAVQVDIDRVRGTARIDFAGTSPQRDDNFNAPRAVTVAAVMYVFRTLLDEAIPLNEGCLRPLEIRVPAGSMLDPCSPHAVVAGNVETSQCIVDALYGALGVQAAAQGTMNNLTFGDARRQYYETIAGGSGAGAEHDGASGMQAHMTNSRLTDPEILEARYPVLLREFSYRHGSGGQGRHSGGDGLVRRIEFREPMSVSILSNRRRVAPFGLDGGAAGLPGLNRLLRRDGRIEVLGATASAAVEAGDAIEIATPGGGGHGKVPVFGSRAEILGSSGVTASAAPRNRPARR